LSLIAPWCSAYWWNTEGAFCLNGFLRAHRSDLSRQLYNDRITFEQIRNLSFRFWIFAGEHNFQTSCAAIFEDPDRDADYVRNRKQLLIVSSQHGVNVSFR